MIKAKFKVDSVTHYAYGSEEIKMSAVISDGTANKEWCKATPVGSLSITIDNLTAQGKLLAGKEYFITFTEE